MIFYKGLMVDINAGKVYRKISDGNFFEVGYKKFGSQKISGKRVPTKPYWVVYVSSLKKAINRSLIVYEAAGNSIGELIIDHINGNSLDDSIQNLRAVTCQQNTWNRKPVNKKSGLPFGVCFNKANKKYQTQITVNGIAKYLGCYETPEKASQVYMQARKENFGEYA